MLGMGCAFAFAFIRGEPGKLITGWDYDQMGCGVKGNVTTKDYPYLYWYEIPGSNILDDIKGNNLEEMKKILNRGTCVKNCPKNDTLIECA